MSSLTRRILVALVAIPATFGLVYVGGWLLVGAVAFLGVVGTAELYGLGTRVGARPLGWLGYVGAVAFPVGAYIGVQRPEVLASWGITTLILWLFATLTFAVVRRAPGPTTLASVSMTILAPVYASALLAFIIPIRHGGHATTALGATGLVFLPLVATWICDTFAMTGGALFGGPKLAPVVSPNKTWSGAASGLMGAILVALLYGAFVGGQGGHGLDAPWLLLLGVAIGVGGQVGDLVESLFKRSAEVKDSGAFFGAHGGVLDRLDSLYWVLPISSFIFTRVGVL